MADATEAFFAKLDARGQEPMLRRTTATIRIDLTGGQRIEHWFISIKRGDLGISRSDGPADLVFSTDGAVFDELAAGRLNPMAATLRGLIRYEGDPSLMVRLQRVFPAPTAPPLGAAASARSAGKRRG